jgi:TetR/AcrR family transcriptional regulator, fatty acid metabolism regulator protein
MPTQTPRQIEIIKASVKLIGRKGLAALTTRNLAKTIGVSEPIIYRHFKNKQAILAGILSFLEENNRKITSAIVMKDAPALDRIGELYVRSFAGFAKAPGLTSAIFSEELYLKEKVLSAKVLGILEITNNTIVDILNEGMQKKEIRTDVTAEQMAHVLMGAMRLAVTKWRLNSYKTDLVARAKELCLSFRKLYKDSRNMVA